MAVALVDLEQRLTDSPGRQPIDIEDLVQWALAQTGYLPWRGVSHRELEYDYGYTALPRHGSKPPFLSRGITLRRVIDDDANTVIEAIKALEPRLAAMIIACGRQRLRPNWLPGVEPKKVPKFIREGKKSRKRKRRIGHTIMVWDIDPATVALCRQQYEAWHIALTRLHFRLADQLMHYRICGFAAPIRPWHLQSAFSMPSSAQPVAS